MSMAAVDGDPVDEASQLWALLGELSSQLKANREVAAALQRQADDLKGQLHHARTGYALRRFNVDVSNEVYTTEMERLHVSLMRDNNALTYENRQLTLLARDYHHTLEQVMAKFRAFCHATQSHVLNLTAHYERQLNSQSYSQAHDALAASTASTATLEHLGSLVRRALRAAEGEDPDVMSDAAFGPSVLNSARNSSSSLRIPSFYGSGGYFGKWHDPAADAADAALESQINEQHLLEENRVLRSLLGIAEEPPVYPSNAHVASTTQATEASRDPAAPAQDAERSVGAPLPPVGVFPGGLPGSEKLSLGLPRNKLRALQAQQQDEEQGEEQAAHKGLEEQTDAGQEFLQDEPESDRNPGHQGPFERETYATPTLGDPGVWIDAPEDDVEEELVGLDENTTRHNLDRQAKDHEDAHQTAQAEGGVEAQVATMLEQEAEASDLEPTGVDASDPPTSTTITTPSPPAGPPVLKPSPARTTTALAPETYAPPTASILTSPRPEARPLPDPEAQCEPMTEPETLAENAHSELHAQSVDTTPRMQFPDAPAENAPVSLSAPPSETLGVSDDKSVPRQEVARVPEGEEDVPFEPGEAPSPLPLRREMPLASPEPEAVLSPVTSGPLTEPSPAAVEAPPATAEPTPKDADTQADPPGSHRAVTSVKDEASEPVLSDQQAQKSTSADAGVELIVPLQAIHKESLKTIPSATLETDNEPGEAKATSATLAPGSQNLNAQPGPLASTPLVSSDQIAEALSSGKEASQPEAKAKEIQQSSSDPASDPTQSSNAAPAFSPNSAPERDETNLSSMTSGLESKESESALKAENNSPDAREVPPKENEAMSPAQDKASSEAEAPASPLLQASTPSETPTGLGDRSHPLSPPWTEAVEAQESSDSPALPSEEDSDTGPLQPDEKIIGPTGQGASNIVSTGGKNKNRKKRNKRK